VFDLYTYEIASLDEYREHLAGVDLYARHHAHTLRLDKEGLRRQVAAAIEKQLGERYAKKKWAPDKLMRVMTSGLARAEERTLHLTDDVTYGKERVGEWALSRPSCKASRRMPPRRFIKPNYELYLMKSSCTSLGRVKPLH
jgi:hypothetical protein